MPRLTGGRIGSGDSVLPLAGARARDVKRWVAQATGASEEATIMVSELSCSEPGCPPYEVFMAVLVPGEPPLQKRLHRRLVELTEADVLRLWQGCGADRHEGERERAPGVSDASDCHGSERE